MKSRFLLISSALLTLFLSAAPVFAAYEGGCTPACSDTEVCTAIGCISTEVVATSGGNTFFESILRFAIGIGGGLALLLMLYGIFIITTSAGMPDKLKEGKEILTSAISGLIFIILSVVLLNFIGIHLLGIPGLQ